jgi:hypothetical protein
VALTDVAVSFLGSMLDKSIGYTAGPGWWSTLVALVVLAGCVVILARQPPFGTAPTVRRDWPAVLGAVVVLAALGWWISRFHPDVGWWFGVYCQGVLLAAACLGVAVLGGDPQYRIAGLAAVTVAGAWVVGTQWHVLATQSYWTTAGDNAGALAAAVVMVGACYLAQLAPGRRRDARAAAAG